MLKMTNSLFAVILLEGFVVLAVELLAIRQLIPFVGSSTDVVAIIIAAVLMPLSFGYYAGGGFKSKRLGRGNVLTIRKKLMRNMLIASVFFLCAISYPLLVLFFEALKVIGVEGERFKVAIYSILFLVFPVFLMGQTIPLVTNYFKYHKLSDITGKILFFSTIGSFCGSIVSTIVLMATIGVHNTVIVIFLLIFCIILLLAKRVHKHKVFLAFCIFVAAVCLNNDKVMQKLHIVSNNQYSTTKVLVSEDGNVVTLNVNHSDSARMVRSYKSMFNYVRFIEQNFITPTLNDDSVQPLDILILGAGGFTMGYGDTKNNYTYVDIDKDLLEIAETYLIEKPLEENKVFFAQGARAYLNENDEKFDLIIVDLYSNEMSIPSHLITQEFYKSIKLHLKKQGVVAMNIIAKPYFDDDYARNIDATIRSVFSPINRHIVRGYNPWVERKNEVNNVYVYVDQEHLHEPAKIYTDNLNTYYLDK